MPEQHASPLAAGLAASAALQGVEEAPWNRNRSWLDHGDLDAMVERWGEWHLFSDAAELLQTEAERNPAAAPPDTFQTLGVWDGGDLYVWACRYDGEPHAKLADWSRGPMEVQRMHDGKAGICRPKGSYGQAAGKHEFMAAAGIFPPQPAYVPMQKVLAMLEETDAARIRAAGHAVLAAVRANPLLVEFIRARLQFILTQSDARWLEWARKNVKLVRDSMATSRGGGAFGLSRRADVFRAALPAWVFDGPLADCTQPSPAAVATGKKTTPAAPH